MNLTFGVCWIEDQANEELKASVEETIRQNGFEPEVELVVSEEDIQSFARRQQHFQDYDLILLDLELGQGRQGDELAPIVRRHFRSTPIVFYSAVTERDLRDRMAKKDVDGVYCTDRRFLVARVGQLVSDLTPTLNRLSGMRGLAAQVVAECDEEFRRILIHLSDIHGNESEIIQSLRAAVARSHERQAQQTQSINSLRDLLATPAISSSLLFKEVRRVLKDTDPSEDVREASLSIRRYSSLVLERRNILSHALEERTDAGWRIDGGSSKPDLTTADFPAFRSDFLHHRGEIRRLRKLLIDQ